MRSSQAGKPNDGPRRRNNRDPEEAEDEDMNRNPREWPFPSFHPGEADTLRRKREATKAITDMAEGLVPVVPFSRPELIYTKPPWKASTAIRSTYEPGIDMLAVQNVSKPPTPQLSHPKWVNFIPRAVSGCPQLGLVMVSEPDASTKVPKRVRRWHTRHPIVPEPDPVAEAARPQRIDQLAKSSATSPRFGLQTKQDITVELLRDERVYQSIQKEVVAQGKHENKNILVSLPKIGVRLFSVSALARLSDSMGKSKSVSSARLPVMNPDVAAENSRRVSATPR
jgi:hypothetical protein